MLTVLPFKQKPVEVFTSIFIILIGLLVVVVQGTQPLWSTVGAILTTLGGVLLSWSTAAVSTAEQAREVLRPQLETVSRHLGTAAGSISRVVKQVQNGEGDAETGLALVANSTRTLYGLVNDLQLMVGAKFSSQDLIATVTSLEELAVNLSSKVSTLLPDDPESHPESREPSIADVQNGLETLRLQLQSTRQKLQEPEQKMAFETVTCPDCGVESRFALGETVGDSSMPTCSSCGNRFHLHRLPDSGFRVVRWGSASDPQVRIHEVMCPHCKQHYRVRTYGEQSQDRFCVKCNTRFNVSPAGSITDVKRFTPKEAEIWPTSAGRAVLRCPDCNYNRTTFLRLDGRAYAVCTTCDQLIFANMPED